MNEKTIENIFFTSKKIGITGGDLKITFRHMPSFFFKYQPNETLIYANQEVWSNIWPEFVRRHPDGGLLLTFYRVLRKLGNGNA